MYINCRPVSSYQSFVESYDEDHYKVGYRYVPVGIPREQELYRIISKEELTEELKEQYLSEFNFSENSFYPYL